MHMPPLTYQEVVPIFAEFGPIGDAIWEISNRLEAAGFSSFIPFEEFIESLGTPDERVIHRRLHSESVKVQLSRPGHLRRPTSMPPVRSVYAEELKAKYRKALGVPPESLIDAFGPREAFWRKELDPCRRAMTRLEIEQREIYQYRREAADESTQERFQAEVPVHAGDIPLSDLSSEGARIEALNEAFIRFGAPLGFRRSPALSKKWYPVYSREISEDWHLCWSLEDAQQFLQGQGLSRALLALRLDFRLAGVKGDIDAANRGEAFAIPLRHQLIGFAQAYWRVANSAEVATVVKAHLALYQEACPAIMKGMERLGGARTKEIP
jgi:hypothetical protein